MFFGAKRVGKSGVLATETIPVVERMSLLNHNPWFLNQLIELFIIKPHLYQSQIDENKLTGIARGTNLAELCLSDMLNPVTNVFLAGLMKSRVPPFFAVNGISFFDYNEVKSHNHVPVVRLAGMPRNV
ncbi:MAG: hypothetical protein ACOCXT_06845 [Candidatus Dojkabacteria bacterium]